MPTDSVKIHATGFAPIARKAGSSGEGLFFHFSRLLQTKDQYYASTTGTGVNRVPSADKTHRRLMDRTETKHNAKKTDKARVKSRAPIRSKPSSTFARSRVKRGGDGVRRNNKGKEEEEGSVTSPPHHNKHTLSL